MWITHQQTMVLATHKCCENTTVGKSYNKIRKIFHFGGVREHE